MPGPNWLGAGPRLEPQLAGGVPRVLSRGQNPLVMPSSKAGRGVVVLDIV